MIPSDAAVEFDFDKFGLIRRSYPILSFLWFLSFYYISIKIFKFITVKAIKLITNQLWSLISGLRIPPSNFEP